MSNVSAARIGVLRPGPTHPVAALAEVRVIRHELERRLGAITLDLRVAHFEPVGPWQPLTHASWPSSIDVLVPVDDLFAEDLGPLTALFARTVEPEAAAVRRRMLDHLGFTTNETFDDDAVAALDELRPTPTDLWLLVGAADAVAVTDPAVAGLADTSADAVADLDAAFDRVAERLGSNEAVAASGDDTLQRVTAERDAARDELAALRLEVRRQRAEFAEAIDAAAAERATSDVVAESP